MAQGFGYDPGAYLTKSNPYAQMLMAQQDPNNGTVGGGLASAIRSGLMGLVMRGDQNREMAARQQQTDAMSEMSRGMAAQPWVNPDTGTVAPGQTNVGGYEGGIAALNRMGNNPYAGRLSSQLMMGATERRNELADAERARAQQLADMAAKFQQQKELEALKARERAQQMIDAANYGHTLDMRAAAAKPYHDAGIPPPGYGAGGGLPPRDVAPSAGMSQPQASAPVQPAPQQPTSLAEARAAAAAAEAEAKARGKASGEARIDLPRVIDTSNEMLGILDKIATFDEQGNVVSTHPGFSGMVGMPSLAGAPSLIPYVGGPVRGTEEANFQVLLNQVQGNQFLQAYDQLKGGGQITEVEGTKAESAIARMSTAQTEEAFLEGVRDFREVIKRARERAMMKAGGGQQMQGMQGKQPPAGISPGDWNHMTPEERALWQN